MYLIQIFYVIYIRISKVNFKKRFTTFTIVSAPLLIIIIFINNLLNSTYVGYNLTFRDQPCHIESIISLLIRLLFLLYKFF